MSQNFLSPLIPTFFYLDAVSLLLFVIFMHLLHRPRTVPVALSKPPAEYEQGARHDAEVASVAPLAEASCNPDNTLEKAAEPDFAAIPVHTSEPLSPEPEQFASHVAGAGSIATLPQGFDDLVEFSVHGPSHAPPATKLGPVVS